MTRLKFELREHIRFLADYEILSTDWLRMAESLHQIANVAFMETHLPPSDVNPLAQQGKKPKGTLWDQERDELAVRILLEEGKLNLALRVLHKFKHKQRSSNFPQDLKATCSRFNSDMVTVTERCRVFEQSLGMLMKYALGHVEALQIMDVVEFVDHVKGVLLEAKDSDKKTLDPDQDKLQGTLVVHYLASLGAGMEEMDEDRVMELLGKGRVIPLLVSHLLRHYQWYRLDTLQASAVFLTYVMQSDSYVTCPGDFVKTDDAEKDIRDLYGLYIEEMVEKYGVKKRDIQALLDQIDKWSKKHGKPKSVPLNLPTRK